MAIQEAHSVEWPTGSIPESPEQHKNIDDRISRAIETVKTYGLEYTVLVDPWGDPFEKTFQAWPDQYYYIDNSKKVLDYSQYNMDAQIINDYSNILNKLLQ